MDPELDLVTDCRRREDGTFPRVAELTRASHDVRTTPPLPELTIELDALFA